MSNNRKMYTREELIDQIKHCGQSIIDNAEGILGDERYFMSLTVIFDIQRNRTCIPDIQVQRRFVPELEIEDFKTYKEQKRRKEYGDILE